jgi:hypothetical protein
LITLSGGTLLLAQLAREFGKRVEVRLFRAWGGNPAAERLRHRGSQDAAVSRRHSKLTSLMDGVTLPSQDEEDQAPGRAEGLYDECIRYLRSKTRDRERFRLLYHENCNYGFWRNLLGLRPMGITVSAAAAVAMGLRIYSDGWQYASPLMWIVLLLNALLLLAWVTIVGTTPVRTAADAYADRLMDAIDEL